MPQMMPLSWLTLMIFFMMIFYLFNNQTFYLFLYKNNKKISCQKHSFNWKW